MHSLRTSVGATLTAFSVVTTMQGVQRDKGSLKGRKGRREALS